MNGPRDVFAADLDGHIDWFETVQFGDSGEFQSSILDTNNPSLIWDEWALNSSLPTGTELSVEVRASNDPDNLGAWVPLQKGELGDYLENGSKYSAGVYLLRLSVEGEVITRRAMVSQ